METMRDKTISIILLSYYSGQRLERCFLNLKSCLSSENIPFELIIVDDGSTDNSYELALELERKHKEVSAYQLSRNYTSHYSIFAGLSMAKGECAIPIPDDEQLPYDLIVDMYRLWEDGQTIIIPFREQRHEAFLSKSLSNMFYKIMNGLSDIHYPVGASCL